jgi:DNA-binding response OmpR family regulator
VEQATFAEWLDSGGFQALAVQNVGAHPREFEALNFEMLLIDAELVTVGALMAVARYRPTPRPVIVIGDADSEAEIDAGKRGASYLVRPIERAALIFAVTLALAEGRPMRRSPRKLVPRFPGLIDGVASRLVDVSLEGVRLEVDAQHRSSLPPYFTLNVPVFNVAVKVQRIWVGTAIGAASLLCCGGALAQNPPRSGNSWRSFVNMTPEAG